MSVFVADSVAACFPAPVPRPALPVTAEDGVQERRSRRGSRPESRSFSWMRLAKSYFSDWILILLLWGLLAVLERTGGHKRQFSLTDKTIQFAYAVHERVPPHLLAIVSVVVPLTVLIPISILVARNAWDVHNAICGLGLSWTMAGVVTQIVKMMVGRPRPDLINRCLPAEGAADAPVWGLSNYTICTSTNQLVLDDGFKSFPSGHSSLSFAGLGFLTFYLAGKMHLWDRYGHRNRAWFALSPLLLAAMVAITRTQDNRHHWQDVLVGSALGLVIAFVSYRTYYPQLAHPTCHLPLLPRPGRDDITDEDIEYEALHPHGLLSDEGVPRPSNEEELVWRQ